MAGRVAAVLFAVAGLLAFAPAGLPGSRPTALVVIGTVDLTVAGIAWWAPWQWVGRVGLFAADAPGEQLGRWSWWSWWSRWRWSWPR